MTKGVICSNCGKVYPEICSVCWKCKKCCDCADKHSREKGRKKILK